MGRDPATLSGLGFGELLRRLRSLRKSDDLLKMLPAVCAKMKEINEADLPYVKDAALFLAREDWAHFAEEMPAFARPDRSLPDGQAFAAVDHRRPASAGWRWRNWSSRPRIIPTKCARSSMRSMSRRFPATNPACLTILRADLALATGDVAGARKQYEALTGEPSGPMRAARSAARPKSARPALSSTGRISRRRRTALNEVAWQAPIEKMSPDWALTRLRLYQEQNLPVAAYLWAKRLLPVITESGRSELLFRLTDLAFAQGDNDLAHKTLSELLKKHPYSEEAAQAKEKWPGPGINRDPRATATINRGLLSRSWRAYFCWRCSILVYGLSRPPFGAGENDWFVPLGKPPEAPPKRISGGEGFPPLPLPATPLRRTERKRQPTPPSLFGKVVWGEQGSFTYDGGKTTQISDWNLCPADLQHLFNKVQGRLGLQYGYRRRFAPFLQRRSRQNGRALFQRHAHPEARRRTAWPSFAPTC